MIRSDYLCYNSIWFMLDTRKGNSKQYDIILVLQPCRRAMQHSILNDSYSYQIASEGNNYTPVLDDFNWSTADVDAHHLCSICELSVVYDTKIC